MLWTIEVKTDVSCKVKFTGMSTLATFTHGHELSVRPSWQKPWGKLIDGWLDGQTDGRTDR